jgi:hypothetical protein
MARILSGTVVVAACLLIFGAPAASAADKCTNPNPAICQYVEDVPTSKGPKQTGVGKEKKVKQLPRSVEKKIREESPTLAPKLEEVATSTKYGAPEEIKATKQEQKRVVKRLRAAEVERNRPIPAALGAVSGSGDGRLLGLVIVMAAMTVAAVAAAVIRKRGTGGSRRN